MPLITDRQEAILMQLRFSGTTPVARSLEEWGRTLALSVKLPEVAAEGRCRRVNG